jgi:MFS family permease
VKSMPANVWLLAVISALATSAAAMMVMVGGVLGAKLAPNVAFSTLPIAMMVVGTACGVLPVTRAMQRWGRRKIFISVALLAMSACIGAGLSAQYKSFSAFALSTFVLGIAISGYQQIRFAAMESVEPELMAKAASTVLLGGLVAAGLGPELATRGQYLLDEEFVGAFYLMAALSVLCALLFSQSKDTHVHTQQAVAKGRELAVIIRQPLFILAVSAAVVGYALMSFVMTATPVHMHVLEHHSLQHTKWVIQSHIVAMFLPSFFSGWLMTKVGVKNVIWLGLLAYIASMTAGLSGNHLINYWLALVLLGIGWNFLYLGGTALLPQCYLPEEKFKVQGLNEFMVFGAQALTALSAGLVLSYLGWQGLLISSLVIIIFQAGLIYWQHVRLRQDIAYDN